MFKQKSHVFKVDGFGPFLDPNYPSRQLKILSKTKILPETTSLLQSNNSSLRSQINYGVLIKLSIKNPFFGPKRDFLR